MTRFLTLLLALLIAAIGVPAHAADEPKAPTQVAFEKGLEFYEAGKFQEALAAFAEFEPGQKHSLSTLAPNAIYFGGWCLVGLKRPQDAVAKFRLVVDKFGDRPIAPEALLKLAETYRDLKQLDNALATYREFQKKFASDKLLPQAMLGEAWVLFKQGKQNGPAKNIAAKVYREYADNASARLDSLFLLGQIYTEEKNYEEARKVYEELKRLRNNPRASEALFLAAESLYSNAEKLKTAGQQDAAVKSFEDSIQYYERVLSKDSLIADVQKQIADIRTRVLRVRDPQVRTALQSRIEELQRLIASISQQNDLRPLALFRVANAYQSVDRPEEASLVYRHFLRLYGNQKELKDLSGQAQFGLIQTLNMRGQAEKAKQATDDFEKNFPEMKGKDIILYAKFLKGDSEFKTKQYKEALASFEDFLKTSKNVELNQTAEFYIAACRFALEDYDKAREAFEEFLKKYPQSPLVADAQFRLGRCHFELAKPEKAGDAKTREAQLKKAAEYYELVRSGGKKQELVPEVVFQLGYLYSFLGEFDAANYEKSATAFREYADKWPDQIGRAHV